MMLENEGLSCFIHTAEVPPLLLLAVCASPEGPAFETLNEDLLLTGGLREWHLLHCKHDHIHRCVKGNTLCSVCLG